MHGFYLKSVKSPAIQGKFKMSYRNRPNIDIFSQVVHVNNHQLFYLKCKCCMHEIAGKKKYYLLFYGPGS